MGFLRSVEFKILLVLVINIIIITIIYYYYYYSLLLLIFDFLKESVLCMYEHQYVSYCINVLKYLIV